MISLYYYVLKRSDFLKHFAIKNFVKKVKNTRLKNTRRFDVLGRHYQVKKRQYEYSINTRKNNSSLRKKVTKICYKLNKELSTDGVTLSVEARPHFFNQ